MQKARTSINSDTSGQWTLKILNYNKIGNYYACLVYRLCSAGCGL